jgi:hypothetical protein
VVNPDLKKLTFLKNREKTEKPEKIGEKTEKT